MRKKNIMDAVNDFDTQTGSPILGQKTKPYNNQ